MPTIVRKLSREKRGFLHGACTTMFLDGMCYEFAIALHQGLGWPMVGLMKNAVVRHAAVMSPQEILCDVRGSFLPADERFGRPFSCVPPYDLSRGLIEEDLRAIRPINEHGISTARKMAEVIWPKLRWNDSLASKVHAFADELEALSKKHGLWIRSSFPTTPPLLAIGMDDEGGYELRPTDDGSTYSISRYLAPFQSEV